MCQSHIDDIVFFQIDLRRTSGTLDHDDIRLFFQTSKGCHDIRHQIFFVRKIVSRFHIAKDFSRHDDL